MSLKLISISCLFVFIISNLNFYTVLGNVSIEFSNKEIQALEQLKPLVEKHLYKDYMKNDHYLIRFLRVKNLNVDDTKEMLLKSISWRKRNKIDSILQEPLRIEKDFHYLVTSDRKGQPVGIVKVSDWKFRRALVASGYDELTRFVYKLYETCMELLREADLANPGKNISQGELVLDLAGFSVRDHTCALCFRFYLHILQVYEQNYPLLATKIIGVNVPRIFQATYELIKPVLSQRTVASVVAYGFDKNEWRKALLQIISNDKLPPSLGGTYVEPDTTKE